MPLATSLKKNLEETIQVIDQTAILTSRSLAVIDIILNETASGEIDKNKFTNLSIASIVESLVQEYVFACEEEKNLVELDIADDFDFLGDKNLMIFLLMNFLRNALICGAEKINITLNSSNKCLYFQVSGSDLDTKKMQINFTFYKKIMQTVEGDIALKFVDGREVEFGLEFGLC